MKTQTFLLAILFLFCAIFPVVVKSSEAVSTDAKPDEDIKSNFLEAARNGDTEGILHALDEGDDIDTVNVNGWSAAFFSVATANFDVLRVLIDRGIDLNIQDNRGFTVLMMAAQERDKELVELLLEANADPTIKAPDGSDAYSIAQASRRLLTAAIILEGCVIRGMTTDDADLILKSINEGAYVNIRSSGGWNPLIYASAKGNTDLVRELIKLGADSNHLDNDGWSPLHFAAAGGHTEILHLLIDAGADVHAVNLDGKSAADLATEGGHTDAAAILGVPSTPAA